MGGFGGEGATMADLLEEALLGSGFTARLSCSTTVIPKASNPGVSAAPVRRWMDRNLSTVSFANCRAVLFEELWLVTSPLGRKGDQNFSALLTTRNAAAMVCWLY